MTDSTELAQSLKAAAENAIGAHERLAAYPYGEIIDISQHEGEQIDIDINDLNEFNKEANPVNIITLVEALEKAQTKNELVTGGIAIAEKLRERIAYLEKRLRGTEESLIASTDMVAELESRTVTVKLPEPFKLAKSSSGLTYYYADEVNEALSAAGIKWEAE
ncbi:TPA: ead/Ea22-like family protein [Klebsiella pneumoniae]